jgi:hypothetical protein
MRIFFRIGSDFVLKRREKKTPSVYFSIWPPDAASYKTRM